MSTFNEFVIENGVIVKYTGTDTDVVVPSELDGHEVRSIGDFAFRGCEHIESVILPDSITDIGDEAFSGCIRLESVMIPYSVKNIGEYLFYNCTRLEDVLIGNGISSISLGMFSGCTSLESVTIRGGVSRIDSYAFSNCTSLESIVVPTTLTSIAASAFSGCYNLSAVYFGGGKSKWSQIVIENGNEALAAATICYKNAPLSKAAFLPQPRFHNHTFGEWRVTRSATCTESGTMECVCPCGERITETIAPTGHTFGEWRVTKQATCTESGSKERTCHCGERETEAIAATGHTFGKWRVTKEATCTESGTRERTCRCGERITEAIAPTGHTFSKWRVIKEATCAESGTRERTCHCGERETETIDTLPHTYTAVVTPPTDTESGYTTYTCSCGHTYKGNFIASKRHSIGLEYSINPDKKTCRISGMGTCKSSELVIPSKIDGYLVTSITNRAFQDCVSLKSVTIPEGVSSIGNLAFSGCKELRSVSIPCSLTSIGDEVFSNCFALSYNTYDSAKYLGNKKCPCVILVKAVNTKITYCEIHESTRVIGSFAFRHCQSLGSVSIPRSVTDIGEWAFAGCFALSDVYYGGSESEWNNIRISSSYNEKLTEATRHYDACVSNLQAKGDVSAKKPSKGLKYSVNSDKKTCKITGTGTCRDTDIVIPSTIDGYVVTGINKDAFKNCTALRSITIPDSVTSIGAGALGGCVKLSEIMVDKKNTVYHSSGNCIIETSSKTLIAGCKNSVIPADGSVRKIGEWAFYECATLESIIIPEGVWMICANAFNNCDGLKSVTIPGSVTNIKSFAFFACTALSTVNYCAGKSEWSRIVIDSYNDNLESATRHYNFVMPKTDHGFVDEEEGAIGKLDYSISSGKKTCKITGMGSCKDMDILIPSTIDGYTVTGIDSFAFYGRAIFKTITIPEGVSGIGNSAFEGCESLVKIVIPYSVTSIGEGVLARCRSLSKIEVDKNNKVYHSSGNCIIETSSKTLVAGCKNSVIPADGSVNIIEYMAFCGCTGLTSITIPSSVTNICLSAFEGCKALKSITLPFVGNTQWGSVNAHFGYIFGAQSHSANSKNVPTSLKNVVITGGNEIAKAAFSGCGSIESITIPNSVTSIGLGAFSGCKSLSVVYYGGSESEWSNISIKFFNSDLKNATRYYYSETQPTTEGNYWHYTGGVPTKW